MNGNEPENDVAAMLDRAARALTELVDGTDTAIGELRADLGRRQAASAASGGAGAPGATDEEVELLEAVLQRTENSRTETLGLVAIMRRARAGLLERDGAPLDVAVVAPEPDAAAAEPNVPDVPDVSKVSVMPIETAEPVPSEAPPAAEEPSRGEAGEGALLLATQMAVAGSSRDEIERCLSEFGVADTRTVLERVFGY